MKTQSDFDRGAEVIGSGQTDWRFVLDHLPVGAFVVDSSGTIRAWNAWLRANTGTDEAEALGRTLDDLFPQHDFATFRATLGRVGAQGAALQHDVAKPGFLIPTVPTDKIDPGPIRQEVWLTPVAGEPDLCLVTVQDVSAWHRRVQQLTQTVTTLEHDSLRDPLTQLYNRRFMWGWLEQEQARARRYGYPVCCLLLDIDNFKSINDSFGHVVGDSVLQAFSRLLISELRRSDVSVRLGGEEFAVFLPQCAWNDGVSRARHILQELRGQSLCGLDRGIVTCSIGIAETNAQAPLTMEEVIAEADEQLFMAKRAGRNRISARAILYE